MRAVGVLLSGADQAVQAVQQVSRLADTRSDAASLQNLAALSVAIQALRGGPLTLSQLILLHAIDQASINGCMPNSRTLAIALGETPVSTWRRVAELGDLAFIQMERLMGRHGIALTLSPAGREALQAAEAALQPLDVNDHPPMTAAAENAGHNGAIPNDIPVRRRVRSTSPIAPTGH